MTQPAYVPITRADEVRPTEWLRTPATWTPDRPAELRGRVAVGGRHRGVPGPDQGYALKLARRFEDRLVLGESEHTEDAVAGCLGVSLRRAALFGRAPVLADLEHAFTLWGFLGGAPSALVEYRRPLFRSAAHHYWEQRDIAERVREATLRLTPPEIASRLSEWHSLLDA